MRKTRWKKGLACVLLTVMVFTSAVVPVRTTMAVSKKGIPTVSEMNKENFVFIKGGRKLSHRWEQIFLKLR